MESNKAKLVTCLKWVKRGIAKAIPDRVKIDQDDLRNAILRAKIGLADEEKEVDAKSPKIEENVTAEEAEIIAKYNLDDYDDEEDNVVGGNICYDDFSDLACHADSHDDPFITVPDEQDWDSDTEDFEIKPEDNLILTGYVEGDCSTIQVYVYNSEEGNLFVHHEMMMPTLPLTLEWLNYYPEDETPRNLVAVGTTSPVIEIWDIDTVDALEPLAKLGNKAKKKKKKPGVGHKDAVLDLSWNTNARHVLASGSADNTVILWDLNEGTPASTLTVHEDKVQSLQWHPTEQHLLLTGSCDGRSRVFDCHQIGFCQAFDVEGEVERVLWNTFDPYYFLASSDTGMVKYFDIRGKDPVWTLSAHHKACTALSISPLRAGMLLTGSFDKTIKLWDFASGTPDLVVEKKWELGQVLAGEFSPDSPYVVCLGGDNRSDCFKVWDIRNSKTARQRFAEENTTIGNDSGDMSE